MALDENSEEKRQLQKLFKEFDSNCGMAALVCGRPVELMPEAEQDRLINGFCTRANLKVLARSQKKLEEAQKLNLTETESRKVNQAISHLESIVEVFSAYQDNSIDRSQLRERIRAVLERPLPDSNEGLEKALSHQIEALIFLTSQELDGKDNWDRMVDCVQLHDALVRTLAVCERLFGSFGEDSGAASGSIEKTGVLARKNIVILEDFFKGDVKFQELIGEVRTLFEEVRSLWGDS